MATLENVERLTALGFQCFPCAPDKKPRVPRGHDWREPYEYAWLESDLIGISVPDNTVVLDIDNIDRFKQSGFEVVQSVYSPTRRDGGIHIYYRTDGRTPPQVTDGDAHGYDTRVGGLGYVIAWYPEDWKATTEWSRAPGWMYETRSREHKAPKPDGAPLGSRLDILSFLGRLAMTGGLGESDYYAVLQHRLATGTIVSLDPARPWTDVDMRTLAREAAKWEPLKEAGAFSLVTKAAAPDDLAGMDADQLLDTTIPPLQWRVPGLMPEGLGLIAAPPKSGKSVFAYQVGVELAFGGEVLGKPVGQAPVLYYALEDGPRRSQTRIKDMLRGRRHGIKNLELRWTSPRLGGELETEVHEWLQQHPRALVIIDVLAKVRPATGKGNQSQNAYDADYDALAGIHKVTKMNPGSTILIVTHDRKAGSEDWMTRVTGTRGVTGAADFVVYIHRDRGGPTGKIVVAGRDVEDSTFTVGFDVTGWRLAEVSELIGTKSPTRQTIFNWLAEHGPAWQADIIKGTGLASDVVHHRVIDMAKAGDLIGGPDGYNVPGAEAE